MIVRVSSKTIIIQEAMSYWDLRSVLDDVNSILLSKGYRPTYYFEGTPIMGQGGFSVIIKLERGLGVLDKKVLTSILRNKGLNVILEDEL